MKFDLKNTVFTPTKIDGEVRLPSSKSQGHRALICGALAGNSTVSGVDLSNDINATVSCLRAMGAQMSYDREKRTFEITNPCGHGIECGEVSCGESASTLRFFIPLAASLGNSVTFTGEGRLPNRPTDIYKDMLSSHGAKLRYPENGEFLPLYIGGQLNGGVYSLRGDISSQFVTGLMFALCQIPGESVIELTTNLESKPYADMTVDVLTGFGAAIEEINGNGTLTGYRITGGRLNPRSMKVEGDCSQAAFFAVAAAVGGRVRLRGVTPATKQGDFEIFKIVSDFGAKVTWHEDFVEIVGGELTARDIDVRNIPDLVPALGVMAALSKGVTRIYGGGRLRIKESDRIATTAAMIRSIGGDVTETEDGLVIVGKDKLSGGRVTSANDHRIAMAAAAASVGCSGDVIVDDMSCINKSYPEFVKDFRQIKIN